MARSHKISRVVPKIRFPGIELIHETIGCYSVKARRVIPLAGHGDIQTVMLNMKITTIERKTAIRSCVRLSVRLFALTKLNSALAGTTESAPTSGIKHGLLLLYLQRCRATKVAFLFLAGSAPTRELGFDALVLIYIR
jgi:hypothetical protein